MPKKTKRQKIATEARKHTMIAQPYDPNNAVATTSQKRVILSETSSFFKKDLVKSLMISLFLLLVEVGIYIAQQNGMSFNIQLSF